MNLVEINDLKRRIEELEKRVTNLENGGSSDKISSYSIQPKKEQGANIKYKGLTGGITFLIDNGFLNTLRSSREIHEELKKEGYIYRAEAVDTILRRDFVSKKKILSRTHEENVWKYGLRK